MALSSSGECDVAFSMFQRSEDAAVLCDIDLTCYETFYGSSPSKVENQSIKNMCSKCDPDCSEVFQRNEINIGYCSRVPDIDYMWRSRDGGVRDVLNLYNIVRSELFSDFSLEDITTCLSYGVDSLAEQTSLGLQQVPTLVDNSSFNITKNCIPNDSVQSCVSPCTPEKGKPKADMADERSDIISAYPDNSTENDSQDCDAQVPSSCTTDIFATGWYHIEE